MEASSDRVVLGRVVGAHGLCGQLRVRFFGDGPETLVRAREVALGVARSDPAARCYAVDRSAPGRSGEVRLALEGVRTREDAEALRGRLVLAGASQLDALPDGEHYWFQWVGCDVFEPDGRRIGTLRELWDTGAHDVLVVEGEAGQQVLIPAVSDWLQEVDLEGRRIVIELVPGLV